MLFDAFDAWPSEEKKEKRATLKHCLVLLMSKLYEGETEEKHESDLKVFISRFNTGHEIKFLMISN